MGEFEQVRWTWQSSDNCMRTGYLSMRGRISLTDLIAKLHEVAPGVAPEEIDLNWATVTWPRPATDEEIAQRQKAARLKDERREAWERRMYEQLRAKYESEPLTAWQRLRARLKS